jgi:thioesterase domain-containing protein
MDRFGAIGVPGFVVMDPMSPVIVLPGAGGGAPDLNMCFGGEARFEAIAYPGWSGYVSDGFTASALIADLVAQIVTRVPRGPIRIVGFSIGGHFGYSAALYLQATGREIAGFCAIDTFMVSSAAPLAGWSDRALARGSDLLRRCRIGEFSRFLRSLFWRALFRLAGSRLPGLLRRFAPSGRLPWIFGLDPKLQEELSMRLLIREVAPWIALLDREPVALVAPTILLRTRFTAGDDAPWRRRCPGIKIIEISGDHQTLFEPENIVSLRESFITATRDWR